MYNLEYSPRYNEAMTFLGMLGINVNVERDNMACKLIEPVSGNEICMYEGRYFVRRRHRDGSFFEPEAWLGVTKDHYDLCKAAGSKIRTVVPKQIIDYVQSLK